MTRAGSGVGHDAAMSQPHPLIVQLRFSRAEFLRGIRGVSDADAALRIGP